MKCKYCGNTVPDGSVFCNICGERLVKAKAKAKTEISVPKPRQLKNGDWYAQMMIKGETYYVTAPTEKEYYAKARAIKSGQKAVNKTENATLRQLMRKYIDANINVLSPETIRTYEIIYKNRFVKYMDKPISAINFQSMISDEAAAYAPKTVSNGWGLVTASLSAVRYPLPDVNLPKIPESDEPFLDCDEIAEFLKTVRGRNVELAAILALHSLRVSEIIDLDVSQIKGDHILVRGATVRDRFNAQVHKDTNKTRRSTRSVPIIIDRLYELLPESGKLVSCTPNTILKNVKKACVDAGVTLCGTHDLRRSFCSLAYYLKLNSQTTMLIGGWSDLGTVEKVYRKLSEREKNEDIEKLRAFFSNITINS